MKNTAVVTGASRGIGRRVSARLIDDGWRVFNLDRLAPASPGSDIWIEVELSDSEYLRNALLQVLNEGPVVGLVNNAGIGFSVGLLDTSDEEFDISTSVNARAPMQCAKMVVPSMRE